MFCNFNVSKTQWCLFIFKYKTDYAKPFKFKKIEKKLKSFEYILWIVILIIKKLVYKDCHRCEKNINS